MIKTNANGQEIWRKRYGEETGFFENSFNQLKATIDGGYIMCGFDNEFDNQAYIVKTDSEGWTRDRFIIGTVFLDQDNDCLQNSDEVGMENWIVTAHGGGKTYTTSTNEAGQYLMEVDSGNYNVTLTYPSTYWEACENPVNTQVSMPLDTAYVDFPLSGIQDCPYLTVDIGNSFLLWCEANSYTVSYCNLGSAIANGAEVEVTLDDNLTFLNASVPIINQNGSTYLFDIGDVDTNECNSFVIEFELSCDKEIIGFAHCTDAQIYPVDFCGTVDPTWDESSIQVEGTCHETNIQFTITNIGNGDMSTAANYNIFENEFLFQQGNFMLESNESTTISVPNNGATYRIETDQSAGHPGSNMPSSVVEGCGAVPFDLGNVNLFELNDADNFVDINCTPNVTSIEPFDKLGQPIGYSEDHFIRPGVAIDYRIRFQHNGPASNTITKVVVRDELSPWLDLSTIQFGAASHDYEFSINDNNTLVFEFNDIILHSSIWNLPQSHGFVKFKIFPKENTPLGTRIFNTAEIYFEEEDVAFSNKTVHTLGENLIEVSTNELAPGISNSVMIYPNPASDFTMIELKTPIQHGNFKLFDGAGNILRHAILNGAHHKLNTNDLPHGLYYFQIIDQNNQMLSGKIVIQ